MLLVRCTEVWTAAASTPLWGKDWYIPALPILWETCSYAFVQLRWTLLDVSSNGMCAFMHSMTKRMPNISDGTKVTNPLAPPLQRYMVNEWQCTKMHILGRSTCSCTVLLGTLFPKYICPSASLQIGRLLQIITVQVPPLNCVIYIL